MWRRPIAIGWIDFLVVSAASLAFTATLLAHPQRRWEPSTGEQLQVQVLAGALGVTPTSSSPAVGEERFAPPGPPEAGPAGEAIEAYDPPPPPPPPRF